MAVQCRCLTADSELLCRFSSCFQSIIHISHMMSGVNRSLAGFLLRQCRNADCPLSLSSAPSPHPTSCSQLICILSPSIVELQSQVSRCRIFQHFSTCSLKAEQWSWFDLIFIFQKIKSYYNEFLPESHDPNTVQCKSIVDHPSHETDLHNPPFDLWISMNYSHIFRRFISHSEPFEWLVTECCCSKDVGLRHGRWKATKRVLHTLTFLWLLLLFSAIQLENPSTGPQAK